MIEDNLLINTNVLRASHEAGVNTLLACLSTCVFPDQSAESFTPINENTEMQNTKKELDKQDIFG